MRGHGHPDQETTNMSKRLRITSVAAAALALIAALALSACGSSKKKSASTNPGASKGSTLALSIAESGKKATFTAPSTAKGGLTQVTLTNRGKAGHGAQFVRLDGKHTVQEGFKVVGAKKTPSWFHWEGGIGATAPGRTTTAALNLVPGRYVVVDTASGPSGQGGPPAFRQMTVTPGGTTGPLPPTPTTITAANPGKDKYRWQVSGPLKVGANTVTFVSKGKTAVHFLGAFRLTSSASNAQIIKALKSRGKPPPFVDQSSGYTSGALDGGKSQTTPLPLMRPGQWVLFCPLTDRDGGKSHFEEGLLKTITVK
jgi:hypothetical protein